MLGWERFLRYRLLFLFYFFHLLMFDFYTVVVKEDDLFESMRLYGTTE